jgi:hypothetical protein
MISYDQRCLRPKDLVLPQVLSAGAGLLDPGKLLSARDASSRIKALRSANVETASASSLAGVPQVHFFIRCSLGATHPTRPCIESCLSTLRTARSRN